MALRDAESVKTPSFSHRDFPSDTLSRPHTGFVVPALPIESCKIRAGLLGTDGLVPSRGVLAEYVRRAVFRPIPVRGASTLNKEKGGRFPDLPLV